MKLTALLRPSVALAALLFLVIPGLARAQVPFPGDDSPTGPSLLVQAKPKLVVEKIQHDFGRIMDTASVFIDIPFKNTGTGTLEILDTHATCGCTLGRLEQTTYAPGQSGILKVEFKPQGKNGPQLQRITIRSNDPVQPESTIAITAEVEPVVMIEPKLLQFGEIKKGESRTATVKVIGRTEDFAATFGTVSNDEALGLEVLSTRDVELNGKKLRETEVKVTLKPKAAVGRLQQSASIRTNDPRMPAVTVQIMGDILGDLEAGPARLALGVLQAQGPIKTELKITSRAGANFKIAEVTNQALNGIDLQFAIKPVSENQQSAYVIEITGTAPKDAVPIRGEVMIKTDVAGEEMIRIPYFGVVRPQNLGAAR
ncbi:MAG: DUF1573 domain-containing protein [Phycisphaerales bacterium]|nr:DUF1573 domain-containing protein [Phycisphaerales bacterium]